MDVCWYGVVRPSETLSCNILQFMQFYFDKIGINGYHDIVFTTCT